MDKATIHGDSAFLNKITTNNDVTIFDFVDNNDYQLLRGDDPTVEEITDEANNGTIHVSHLGQRYIYNILVWEMSNNDYANLNNQMVNSNSVKFYPFCDNNIDYQLCKIRISQIKWPKGQLIRDKVYKITLKTVNLLYENIGIIGLVDIDEDIIGVN